MCSTSPVECVEEAPVGIFLSFLLLSSLLSEEELFEKKQREGGASNCWICHPLCLLSLSGFFFTSLRLSFFNSLLDRRSVSSASSLFKREATINVTSSFSEEDKEDEEGLERKEREGGRRDEERMKRDRDSASLSLSLL